MAFDDRRNGAHELFRRGDRNGAQRILVAGKIVVEGPARDAGQAGYVVDDAGLDSLLTEHDQRRVHQSAAHPLAAPSRSDLSMVFGLRHRRFHPPSVMPFCRHCVHINMTNLSV
jgi:hypothetical protein